MEGISLAIQLATLLHKPFRFLFHTFAERDLFVHTLDRGVVAYVLPIVLIGVIAPASVIENMAGGLITRAF